AKRSPGFDFWLDPQRRANIAMIRGSTKDAVLDFGGTVNKITRTFDSATYANLIRQSGALPSQAYSTSFSAPDITTRPEGGWATAVGDTRLVTPDAVQLAGKGAFERMSKITPAYQATLRLGAWQGPDHIWLGDVVQV